MIFSDLYKSPKSPLSKLRHLQPSHSTENADYDPDLLSRDKTKQKEAVKRHLAARVRNDWEFVWPPVAAETEAEALVEVALKAGAETQREEVSNSATSGDEVVAMGGIPSCPTYDENAFDEDMAVDPGDQADSETESVYSTVSEDPTSFRARAEWASDLSDDASGPSMPTPISPNSRSPFRFDSPDAVGTTVQAAATARKTRRRREIRAESQWNPGLACFLARRDAWTGARTVRVKPKPPSPASPSSPRKTGLWRLHSRSKSEPASIHAQRAADAAATVPLSPVASNSSTPSERASNESSIVSTPSNTSTAVRPHPSYAVETIVPIPVPILPPANPMRAYISPALYASLYDKVVSNSLQPSCPINLADIVRSCVTGWKRDGEWPPRPAAAEAVLLPLTFGIRGGTYVGFIGNGYGAKKKKDTTEGAGKRRGSENAGRRLSFGALLSKTTSGDGDREKEGNGEEQAPKRIKNSIQKVLRLGHSQGPEPASSLGARLA